MKSSKEGATAVAPHGTQDVPALHISIGIGVRGGENYEPGVAGQSGGDKNSPHQPTGKGREKEYAKRGHEGERLKPPRRQEQNTDVKTSAVVPDEVTGMFICLPFHRCSKSLISQSWRF